MKFLLDTHSRHIVEDDLVCGQLLTPLTNYKWWGGRFAIDNGAYSNFDLKAFKSLLDRRKSNCDRCLFVTVPDIVGNGRRTLEIFRFARDYVPDYWKVALVLQDGCEDLDIPWEYLDAVFVGGRDPWKDSNCVIDICKTARILNKHVHVGRVNTARRFKKFMYVADTCDGSGVCRYSHMMESIRESLLPERTMFDELDEIELQSDN